MFYSSDKVNECSKYIRWVTASRLHDFKYNPTIFWVNSDNRVCHSHIQENLKLREKTEKAYKNVA